MVMRTSITFLSPYFELNHMSLFRRNIYLYHRNRSHNKMTLSRRAFFLLFLLCYNSCTALISPKRESLTFHDNFLTKKNQKPFLISTHLSISAGLFPEDEPQRPKPKPVMEPPPVVETGKYIIICIRSILARHISLYHFSEPNTLCSIGKNFSPTRKFVSKSSCTWGYWKNW